LPPLPIFQVPHGQDPARIGTMDDLSASNVILATDARQLSRRSFVKQTWAGSVTNGPKCILTSPGAPAETPSRVVSEEVIEIPSASISSLPDDAEEELGNADSADDDADENDRFSRRRIGCGGMIGSE
jgi:hypothetical protein